MALGDGKAKKELNEITVNAILIIVFIILNFKLLFVLTSLKVFTLTDFRILFQFIHNTQSIVSLGLATEIDFTWSIPVLLIMKSTQ